jgi:dihydroflavonol-4-reductase
MGHEPRKVGTRILVTGGTGFIGHHLVSALAAQGQQVRVLDRRPPRCAVPNVEYVMGSVLDAGLVDETLRDIGEVYHLAGLPGMWLPKKDEFHAVNFLGTEAVIAAARKRGVARFLHCSTESILFRRPTSPNAADEPSLLPPQEMPGLYTRSKMLAEQAAAQAAAAGFPLVIGTPTMPIGPHDHNLTPPTAMLRHFLSGRIQMYLDFVVNLVDVRDVAAGLLLTMERGRTGHRYILGGESISLKKILNLMAAISGHPYLSIPVPGMIAEAAATIMEFISDHITHRPPSGTAEGVRIARRATELSIAKARSELGYQPRPIEPALRDTIAYLLADGKAARQA